MADAFICDFIRTPIGRYDGSLARVRADDLAAHAIRSPLARHPPLAESIDEVFFGCANQAGEDNRNVARMALLLAGLPAQVPGVTLNCLCASGLDAVGAAARALKAGEIDLAIAGGVESMTRAPFVMGKAEKAFQRTTEVFDTTIGWRFVNAHLKGTLWRGLHAGDGRERGPRLRGVAPRPGCLCAALPDARRPGAGRRVFLRGTSAR